MTSAANLDQVLEMIKSEAQLVIDFWAPWCGPCKIIEPHLSAAATQWEGKVAVLKVNLEEIPAASQQFNVGGLPTLVLFKGGTEVKRKVGTAGGLAGILGMVD